VDYGQKDDDSYVRAWDIAEIAVNDYMQLLASPNARRSFTYDDSAGILAGNSPVSYIEGYFNSLPQENLNMELAAEVDGLYEYLLKAGGICIYKGGGGLQAKYAVPSIVEKPKIKLLRSDESFLNPRYTLEFEPAVGNGPFEYTVVMYPENIPYHPMPLKTLADGDELTAVFGTVVRQEEDGSLTGIFEYYGGKYTFRIFAMDANGYYYSSELFQYDFGDDFFDLSNYLEQ
jgi:hypothetical protein